jgi:hypothetical protein
MRGRCHEGCTPQAKPPRQATSQHGPATRATGRIVPGLPSASLQSVVTMTGIAFGGIGATIASKAADDG